MTQRSTSSAVGGAHRGIRMLLDGEGPFTGELVTRGDDVAVRVRAEELRGWPGWAFAGAEHVAAPLDVVMRLDGQDVLLPWCVCTAVAHLARGSDEGPLPHGEAVTLAVSVLRGLLEIDHGSRSGGDDSGDVRARLAERDGEEHAGGSGDRVSGVWWLTGEGRPVFVIAPDPVVGVHRAPWVESAELLEALAERVEDRALRRVLTRLIDALGEPRRLSAEPERWERELLEIAAPRALRVCVDGDAELGAIGVPAGMPALRQGAGRSPRRRDLRASASRASHRVRADQREAVRARAVWRSAARASVFLAVVAGRVRHGVVDRGRRVGALHGGVRRSDARRPARATDARPERRRWAGPALVASSVGVAIAVAGALWPNQAGTPDAVGRTVALASATPGSSAAAVSAQSSPQATAPAAPRTAPATPVAASSAPASPRRPGASAQQDPQSAAGELIAAAQSCQTATEPACAQVWDSGTPVARALRAGAVQPVLIEDYGDIAAIRNGAGAEAQMVVIIRRDAEWRIRDVYDIADPPSEGAGAP